MKMPSQILDLDLSFLFFFVSVSNLVEETQQLITEICER